MSSNHILNIINDNRLYYTMYQKIVLTENSVRDINTIKELEIFKI